MISGRSKDGFGEDLVYKEEATEQCIVAEAAACPPPATAKLPRKDRLQHPSSTSFNVPFQYIDSGRRNQVMICEGRKYIQNNKYGEKIYWKCSKWHDSCKARAITLLTQPDCIIRRNEHNHPKNSTEKDEEKDDAKE
jgi:hypothetical protein